MKAPTMGRGLISLVGAGPGNSELLTLGAARRLAEADLVLYDALLDLAMLDLAPAARRVFVGKRSGRPAVRQEFIHHLMIRAARGGQRVVRLKGGDPFVFGRGGEEALALAQAGVRVEVVPGVSAAVAAPGLAGIPVTHRGVATGFVVVTGHAEAAYRPLLESLPPHGVTVVVMMGVARAAAIASLLVDRGWSTATPAAIIFGASTSESEVTVLALGDLARGPDVGAASRPGTIVVGDVVDIRARVMAALETADDPRPAAVASPAGVLRRTDLAPGRPLGSRRGRTWCRGPLRAGVFE
jgi:uroporphyrin-III C-methyltransferase / precorrin-2 dehydrogenase / sirohydrochlorin ferrochelatase